MKLGGGLGATITAVIVQALIDKVGIPWTFRIFGFVSLISGISTALLIRGRVSSNTSSFIDLSLFKSISFCCLFLADAINTFTLFVLSFSLSLFAHLIEHLISTGADIVAAFNAYTANKRFEASLICEKSGFTNTLLLTMALNAVNMLVI